MPLAVHATLVFIFTKCIDRLHVSTSSETSFFFFFFFLFLLFLAYSSPSFHLIAHPHNFLIRFCRKNEKDRNVIAPRLLFFLVYANERRTSVFGILVLLLFFFLRLRCRHRQHRRRRHFKTRTASHACARQMINS